MLQTVELAKLKCTVTMGTLGEKEEKKRLTMKYRKRQRQYVLLNYLLCLFRLLRNDMIKQSNLNINFNNSKNLKEIFNMLNVMTRYLQ